MSLIPLCVVDSIINYYKDLGLTVQEIGTVIDGIGAVITQYGIEAKNIPTLSDIANNLYTCLQPTISDSLLITSTTLGTTLIWIVVVTAIFVLLIVVILMILDRTEKYGSIIGLSVFLAILYIIVVILIAANGGNNISNNLSQNETKIANCVNIATTALDDFVTAQKTAISNAICVYPAHIATNIARGTIAFSSSYINRPLTTQPMLLGFGNSTLEIVNSSNISISPPDSGSFTFPIQFFGTVSNLQVSADISIVSVNHINMTALPFIFEVYISSNTNNANDGTNYIIPPTNYQVTTLSQSLSFGGGSTLLSIGNFVTATDINKEFIIVNSGDRVGVRVRVTDGTSIADVNTSGFSAILSYVPT